MTGPNSTAQAGVRILHLEDNLNDSELIKATLQGQLVCHITVVATRAAFEAELERNAPDLILSDSSLPGFDGFSALALATKKLPAVPFIFCSGNIPDLMKVEAARHGATDFISKDDLAGLVTLIKRLG